MISNENLMSVSIILTERKLQLCRIILDSLKKEGIVKSEDEVVKAVNQIKNEYLLTENEIKTQIISGHSFPIHDILKSHPNLLEIIYNNLFN